MSTIQLGKPDARIGAASQVDFLELAAAALGESLLGFTLGRDFDLRRIGLLYYAAATSLTLDEALDQAQRYSAVVNEGIGLQCTAAGDLRIAIRHTSVARHFDRQQTEFIVTVVVRLCRALTNRMLIPKKVCLVHQLMGDASEFERFMEAHITFGTTTDEVVFNKEELVGYRGVSAFTHACRRWKGMTSGQIRDAAGPSGSA